LIIMSLAYQIMYRLGVTPWDGHATPEPLIDLIEGPRALPPGHMLDIGCGTGQDAIYCARHGWTVTGVDAVGRALEAARHNADQAGATVRLLHADIAAPGIADLGAEYSLLLDGGCLHGLPDRSLRRAVATITDAAKPGATLLMLAFAPGRRGPVPRGIDPAWIPSLFPQWDLTFSRPASEVMINKRLRNASPSWHQLTRQ
jgi:SAM-dependent methyltransferase